MVEDGELPSLARRDTTFAQEPDPFRPPGALPRARTQDHAAHSLRPPSSAIRNLDGQQTVQSSLQDQGQELVHVPSQPEDHRDAVGADALRKRFQRGTMIRRIFTW